MFFIDIILQKADLKCYDYNILRKRSDTGEDVRITIQMKCCFTNFELFFFVKIQL